MEWAYTAQVFGNTLDILRQNHTRTSAECEFGLDKRAAAEFLSSFHDKNDESKSLDCVELRRKNMASAENEHQRVKIDLTKKVGWRYRLVHWFTDSHSQDREAETSYFDLLHKPLAEVESYDPLSLDYSQIYWSLNESQRDTLTRNNINMDRRPLLSANPTKDQLNQVFMAEHPLIDRSFTGSKLRSLKRLLLDLTSEIQPVTLAAAWVYFEKVVSMNKVMKENRRLVFGACVSLSCKFHEDKRSTMEVLSAVCGRFSNEIVPRDIAESEFYVFAALCFNLRVLEEELLPHLMMLENHTCLEVVSSP